MLAGCYRWFWFWCNLVPINVYRCLWRANKPHYFCGYVKPKQSGASLLCLSGNHWQWVVLLAGSPAGMKPLLRLLGLGGVGSVGVVSTLEAGSTTEKLFCGSRGCTSMVLGTTDACLSPSALSGGLLGLLASELGGLGLHEREGLWALRSAGFESSSCGSCCSGSGASLPSGVGSVHSGGGSCCMLPCLEVPDPGISQLSVRRREPSCIRLVATTAFMAACPHTHVINEHLSVYSSHEHVSVALACCCFHSVFPESSPWVYVGRWTPVVSSGWCPYGRSEQLYPAPRGAAEPPGHWGVCESQGQSAYWPADR